MIIQTSEMESVIKGVAHNPHQWLGMHRNGSGPGLIVRAWDRARSITLESQANGKSYSMTRIHPDGFFGAFSH